MDWKKFYCINWKKYCLLSFLFFLPCTISCFSVHDELASLYHRIEQYCFPAKKYEKLKSHPLSKKKLQLISEVKNLNLNKIFEQVNQLEIVPDEYPQTEFLTKKRFGDTFRAFSYQRKNQLSNVTWLKNNKPGFEKSEFFVRKLILPADHTVEFHADWHGDVHSFILWLNHLKDRGWFKNDHWQLKEKHTIVLLGDYTDRGHYGAEILFIIMQLYLRNLDNVVIIRGNHENLGLNARYGFISKNANLWQVENGELIEKFNYSYVDFKKIEKLLYKNLSSALYLGCQGSDGVTDYIMYCHGGFLVGYDQKTFMADENKNVYQWIDKRLLTNTDYLKKKVIQLYKNVGHKKPEKKANDLLSKYKDFNGFLWADFSENFEKDPTRMLSRSKRGAGYIIESPYMVHTVDKSSEKGKFRFNGVVSGHQHILLLLDCKNHKKIIDHENKKKIGELKKGSNTFNFPRYGSLLLPVASQTGFYENSPAWYYIKYYETSATLTFNNNGFEKWHWALNRIPIVKQRLQSVSLSAQAR